MDPHELPDEETAQERPDPELFRVRYPFIMRWLVLGTLALAGMIALVVTLVLPVLMEQAEPHISAPAATSPEPLVKSPLVYEEPQSVDLQEQAIHVDALITRTLIELGANPASIEAYAFPSRGSAEFRARSLGFQLQADPVTFQAHLGDLLKAHLPNVVLTPSGPRQFSIIIDGIRSHELFLELPDAANTTSSKTSVLPIDITGHLAIVIDDLGEDTRLARGLAETGMEITFAVWPYSSHKDAVRALAKEYNLDMLVHLPMEPLGYPDVDPGPNALFADMTADQIATTIKTNLDQLPEAIGVNNHMGSRFTGNGKAMTAALQVMQKRGLFFLDSRTTGKSKGLVAAKTTSTTFYGRDVFIDNEQKVPYIIGQLKKAESLARRRGNAVAIGHPHPETLDAIRIWAAQAGKDVAVVRISDLPPILQARP